MRCNVIYARTEDEWVLIKFIHNQNDNLFHVRTICLTKRCRDIYRRKKNILASSQDLDWGTRIKEMTTGEERTKKSVGYVSETYKPGNIKTDCIKEMRSSKSALQLLRSEKPDEGSVEM